jgi:hypothetical protein
MCIFFPHSILMLPCCILRTVPGPLDLYNPYGSILELFSLPVQYAHWMHLQYAFFLYVNNILINNMISIEYIFLKK